MLIDVGLSISGYDRFALITRRHVILGAADPHVAWVPLAVAGTIPDYQLTWATVRLADKPTSLDGEWGEPRRPDPAIGQKRGLRVPGVGKWLTFACRSIDLQGVDVASPDGVWLVIEAEATPDDGGEPVHMATTTNLRLATLASPTGWYCGDAHTHSQESDGVLPLDETVMCAAQASGMSWVVMTDHAGRISSWQDYTRLCSEAQSEAGVLANPGAEFAAKVPLREGHVLGLDLRPAPEGKLPAGTGCPQAVVSSVLTQNRPESFAAIAHPYSWLYNWPDWHVTGFRAIELATGGGGKASALARYRWFRLLRRDLDAWDGTAKPEFVVGIATGDSHAVPLGPMPGERHMTWVYTDGDQPPSDRESLFKHMRAGRCVASCSGDFGSMLVNGTGPGDVCQKEGDKPLVFEFTAMPRGGHRLESIRLHGSLGSPKGVDITQSGTLVYELSPPPDHKAFYIAQFTFRRGENRFDVWTNPVWLGTA